MHSHNYNDRTRTPKYVWPKTAGWAVFWLVCSTVITGIGITLSEKGRFHHTTEEWIISVCIFTVFVVFPLLIYALCRSRRFAFLSIGMGCIVFFLRLIAHISHLEQFEIAKFDHIAIGMTKDDVSKTIGLPPGIYRAPGWNLGWRPKHQWREILLTQIKNFGLRDKTAEKEKMRNTDVWIGPRHRIHIYYDGEKRVVGGELFREVVLNQPNDPIGKLLWHISVSPS